MSKWDKDGKGHLMHLQQKEQKGAESILYCTYRFVVGEFWDPAGRDRPDSLIQVADC